MLEFLVIAIILAAASVVVGELLRPKPKFENAKKVGLGDFNFPTAEEGRVIPIIWGTVKLNGPNVVWYGDFTQKAISKTVKTGLWSSKKIIQGYKYFLGMQMALCRGPIDGVRQTWIGDKFVNGVLDLSVHTPLYGEPGSGTVVGSIDQPRLFGGNDLGSGGVVAETDTFMGTPDQGVSGYLAGILDPLPKYRGTAHVVIQHGYLGNTTSLAPWSFEVQRIPHPVDTGDDRHIVNEHDANPAYVALEILTNTEWGLGIPLSSIHVNSFDVAALTLWEEGNGFSCVLDSPKEARDLLSLLQEQMDGIVYYDSLDGLVHLHLTRDDYDIDTVDSIDSSNIVEITDYTRGAWSETFNQVRIEFADRAKRYNQSYAVASDLANQRIQEGITIPTTISYPGVKDAALAQQLAARQLMYLSTPLAKATIVVDRTFWGIKPTDVVKWTDERLGFADLPMRVGRVDYGELTSGRITLSLVQDIFQSGVPFDGEDGGSLWEVPSQGVTAFSATQQLAFEAPRALCTRDPDNQALDRIFAAGRAPGAGEASFKIYQRNDAGSPSGPYSDAGEVTQFMLIGELRAALHTNDAQPTASMEVTAVPDSAADLLAAITQDPAGTDIGQNLTNLLLVGDEFIAVTRTVDHSTWVDFQDVHRGLLDTVPAEHAIGDKVYLLCAGAGLSDDTIPQPNNVDVQLRPLSRDAEVSSGSVTVISFQMANRARRPYPPTELTLNGTRYDDLVDLDTPGPGATTDDDLGITIDFRRKDYRYGDEVRGVQVDASDFASDFPVANTHKNRAAITIDPSGTPISAGDTDWQTGAELFFSRTEILAANAGVMPTRLRVELDSQHVYEEDTFESLQKVTWDFDVDTSELDDDTNMGVLGQSVTGAAYAAPTTGTYAFSVGPNMSGGDVEARINGGAWGAVITSGNRTGNLVGVNATDTIEVRHTQASTGTYTFLRVNAPASTQDAYAILNV